MYTYILYMYIYKIFSCDALKSNFQMLYMYILKFYLCICSANIDVNIIWNSKYSSNWMPIVF